MTKLNYLNDTYLFESEAVFLEVSQNEKGKAVILDETIFYPQGGGQPADKGEIISGVNIFTVNDVRLDETGTVWHFGEFKNGELKQGDKVVLKIDQERRILNARLHSAGHLLDCAVTKIGIENLKPTKGFHFPDGPYVEYSGTIENPAEIIPLLQKNIDNLLEQNLPVEKKDLSPAEAQAKGVWAPAGKSARVVNFAGFPICGCGGTHVKTASEIGKITIRKIKSNQGTTRIAYSVT
ncbi:MAG: alanine--tRNA ligase-related protein [Candidatus Shapirobacteria bacterium]|jgi:Ser-tRNA(Ala) deacylase AlaX